MSESPLRGQRILITGASGVLGSALALTLAQAGAELILLGRRQARLENIDDSITAATGHSALLVELDFERASDGHYAELAAALAAEGGLDGLILASGGHTGLHPLEHLKTADWRKLMALNVDGPFALIKHLLPLLRATRGTVLAALNDPVISGKAYWGAYGCAQASLRALLAMGDQENEGRVGFVAVDLQPMPSPLRGLVYPGENPTELPPPDGNVRSLLDAFEQSRSRLRTV